ncbi:MAG TPA: nuclear transport factor 2 family protein [Polyangiales bacterium]|nr:nuclear transport factor 2 family protein [Polyangiales bacterium]
MSDRDELRSLVASWLEAIRAGDLDGVLARHADDVVLFDVAPPLCHRGLAACREAWAPFLDGGPHRTFELRELSLHVGADVAFAHALARTDQDEEVAVRVTLGFAKRGGRWAIVHEHHSAPITA